MKKVIDFICPAILVIIGIIIIFPPRPEPICPACGLAFEWVFSKVAAIAYIGIGGFTIFNKYQNGLKSIGQ